MISERMTLTLGVMASSRWGAAERLPFPLGATHIEEDDAYNFALYSKHAESVMLLLYTENDIVNPVLAYRFDYPKNKSDRIWHCRIPLASMSGASYYAYSVEGPEPNGGFEWHWFDREKILLDPYAKSVFFPPTFDRLAAVRLGSNAGKVRIEPQTRYPKSLKVGHLFYCKVGHRLTAMYILRFTTLSGHSHNLLTSDRLVSMKEPLRKIFRRSVIRPKWKLAVLDVMVCNALVTGHRSENCLSDFFPKTRTHTIDRGCVKTYCRCVFGDHFTSPVVLIIEYRAI
jgi:hypothetical protein